MMSSVGTSSVRSTATYRILDDESAGLFPIRERGVNHLAQPLQPREARGMSSDSVILARLLRSYKMVRYLPRNRPDKLDVVFLRDRIQLWTPLSRLGQH